MTRLSLRVVLVAALGFCAVATGAQETLGDTSGEKWLTFRALPDIRPETLRRIAESVEPEVERVDPGTNLVEHFRDRYGSFESKLWAEFIEKNPWANEVASLETGTIRVERAILDQARDVVWPGIPSWHRRVDWHIPENSNVWLEARSIVGTAGNTTQDWIRRNNPQLESGLANVRGDLEIRLPYASRYVSYRISPTADLDELQRALAADDAVKDTDFHGDVTLPAAWDETRLGSSAADCAKPSASDRWPFESLFVDGTTPSEFLRQVLRGSDRARIAILDSGLPRGDDRFPLWQNWLEVRGLPGEDDDRNRYMDDEIGVNLLTRSGFPVDDTENAAPHWRSHGTHVAGVASGRLAPPEILEILDQRLELMVLKVADKNGKIELHNVYDAVLYGVEHHADILNLSLAGQKDFHGLRGEIERRPQILFITASGNGDSTGLGVDLASQPFFPAALSEELDHVLSVAAHDGEGNLTCFSNYGDGPVDLAAPGVRVSSTAHDLGTKTMSGTSQAAPLVTLTAALLRSQGLREPRQIKERLLTSVDPRRELCGKVASAGILDMGKAIAIYDDLVELRDGRLLVGRLLSPTAFQPKGEDPIPVAQVRQIAFDFSCSDLHDDRVVTSDGRALTFRDVDLELESTEIEIEVDGVARTLPVTEIATIVPATRLARGV